MPTNRETKIKQPIGRYVGTGRQAQRFNDGSRERRGLFGRQRQGEWRSERRERLVRFAGWNEAEGYVAG